MARRLPPLNALRAFEAAARHGSFVSAANELSVTPAAISHQVKGLEETLGVTLFMRRHRAVTLTREGRRLLPGLTDAFDQIATSVDAVRAARHDGAVVVSCSPSFAAKWLVPRLEGFLSRHPEYTVRVEAEPRVVDLADGEVDLAVRFSTGGKGDVSAERLFGESVFPVCAPRLRVGLRRASELALQTLLYDEMFERVPDSAGWADWLTAAGLPHLKPARVLHYSFTTLALDAAIRGQGVALGRSAMVAGDLQAGTLVKLFDLMVPGGVDYHIVYLADRPNRPAVTAFRDWLLAEADAFRKQWPDLIS